jgi:peptidase propeptide and YPEB domain protein
MENMKKFNKLGKSLIGAATVTCMLFAAGMTGVPYYGSSFVAKSKVSKSYKATKKITADEAKRIALAHAGVGSARFKKAKLDYENGVRVYEIEFKVGNLEYEYDINVSNGAIISSSVEVDD